MKIIAQGFVSPIGERFAAYNAWPTVISLSDGTLLAAWSGERLKHMCPFGKVKAARSTDGGYTWSEPYTLQNTPLDDRDAGLCEVAPGTVLMTSFAAGRAGRKRFLTHWLHGPRSTEEREMIERHDAEITDADEARYAGPTLAVSKDNGYTFSAPVHVQLTSPHGPLLLRDGRIFHVGSLGSTEIGARGVYYTWLDDDCNVLEPITPLMLQPENDDLVACEPYAAQMPNGDILVAIRVQSKKRNLYTVYLSRSTDGGKTFSEPQPTGFDGMPAHMFVTSKNEVVLAYGVRTMPMGVRARISRDNGYTWGEEIILRDDGIDWDLGYPTTTENANGELVTVYYMKDRKGLNENRIQYTIWKI
ncbi:MAG: exo-alpha-sialidase [Clostridia bacterium]|nr:exo-alpha-sialidase [Clostridia bacterium]